MLYGQQTKYIRYIVLSVASIYAHYSELSVLDVRIRYSRFFFFLHQYPLQRALCFRHPRPYGHWYPERSIGTVSIEYRLSVD